ncbi:MAG: succinate dehydrogenase assembly factor 4 [Gammaproteobacteria bacterium]
MSKNTPTDCGNITENENKNPPNRRQPAVKEPMPKEVGGRSGPEPTRYGDWEYKGRCIDF